MALDLRFFTPEEFVLKDEEGEYTDWWALMSPRLLVLTDVFRFQWGASVTISPHHRALGRRLGVDGSESDHNVDRWGEVRGLDCFPEGMRTRADAERALEIARSIGFTSLGLYPDWHPSPGLHLGVRKANRPGNPATWGAIGHPQAYTSLVVALEQMR